MTLSKVMTFSKDGLFQYIMLIFLFFLLCTCVYNYVNKWFRNILEYDIRLIDGRFGVLLYSQYFSQLMAI